MKKEMMMKKKKMSLSLKEKENIKKVITDMFLYKFNNHLI